MWDTDCETAPEAQNLPDLFMLLGFGSAQTSGQNNLKFL